jgi:hypothetical protein
MPAAKQEILHERMEIGCLGKIHALDVLSFGFFGL